MNYYISLFLEQVLTQYRHIKAHSILNAYYATVQNDNKISCAMKNLASEVNILVIKPIHISIINI